MMTNNLSFYFISLSFFFFFPPWKCFVLKSFGWAYSNSSSLSVSRLLHLAIIHEATDYIKMMIELSKNTDFLDVQNDQRQVCELKLVSLLTPPLDAPLHRAIE